MENLMEDPQDTVWISIPLDPLTAARLRNLSDVCHADPIGVAASLLHDVLAEDDEAHSPSGAEAGAITIN
jgi:hypothetical protein